MIAQIGHVTTDAYRTFLFIRRIQIRNVPLTTFSAPNAVKIPLAAYENVTSGNRRGRVYGFAV